MRIYHFLKRLFDTIVYIHDKKLKIFFSYCGLRLKKMLVPPSPGEMLWGSSFQP